MTSHELARKLLEQPDHPIMSNADWETGRLVAPAPIFAWAYQSPLNPEGYYDNPLWGPTSIATKIILI